MGWLAGISLPEKKIKNKKIKRGRTCVRAKAMYVVKEVGRSKDMQ